MTDQEAESTSLSASQTPEKSFEEKSDYKNVDIESVDAGDSEFAVLQDERDIATHVITVHDDPTLNAWTFRAFFIGIALSAFGGVLGMFHPQSSHKSLILLQRRFTISNLLVSKPYG